MEEIDYVDFSEALHSSYLFYTMEVDKLNKENKRLREALEKIVQSRVNNFNSYIIDIAKQALGE